MGLGCGCVRRRGRRRQGRRWRVGSGGLGRSERNIWRGRRRGRVCRIRRCGRRGLRGGRRALRGRRRRRRGVGVVSLRGRCVRVDRLDCFGRRACRLLRRRCHAQVA
ncbi:MAG: hypothetical protein EBZ50_01385 [Alphaproteobacteria bacterium]|nr:hypothetical protein [Alphaproteobacteria bacterium]